MKKEEMESRLKEIDSQLIETKLNMNQMQSNLNQMQANFNALEGAKHEVLFWLSKFENNDLDKLKQALNADSAKIVDLA